MAVVRQKSTGMYLTMAKFDLNTKKPLYGPLEKSWIAFSYEQAAEQAASLGEDHEAVKLY